MYRGIQRQHTRPKCPKPEQTVSSWGRDGTCIQRRKGLWAVLKGWWRMGRGSLRTWTEWWGGWSPRFIRPWTTCCTWWTPTPPPSAATWWVGHQGVLAREGGLSRTLFRLQSPDSPGGHHFRSTPDRVEGLDAPLISFVPCFFLSTDSFHSHKHSPLLTRSFLQHEYLQRQDIIASDLKVARTPTKFWQIKVRISRQSLWFLFSFTECFLRIYI